MDIFSIFQENHASLLGNLEILCRCPFSDKLTRKIHLKRIKNDLNSYTRIEESAFYFLLKIQQEDHPQIIDAFNEHHFIGILVMELDASFNDYESWKRKLTDFNRLIKKHFHGEDAIFERSQVLAAHGEMQKLYENLASEQLDKRILVSAA